MARKTTPKKKLPTAAQAGLTEKDMPAPLGDYVEKSDPFLAGSPYEEYDNGIYGDGPSEGGGFKITMKETADGRGITAVDEGERKAEKAEVPKVLREVEAGDTFTQTVFSEGNVSEGFLTDEERLEAMRQSVKAYREDPLYRDVINNYTYFIIGKGLVFKAADENPKIQEHLWKFWKENRMDGRDTEIIRRYLKIGEVMLRYFSKTSTGAVAKVPRVRFVPFWRLSDIAIDPEDIETITGFKINKVKFINGVDVGGIGEPQEVLPEDIQWMKNATPEETRGEPLFLTILRPCRWYADWIFNRVVLNRFRSAHVLFKKIKGSPNRVNSVNTGVPNTTRKGEKGKLMKRLPKPGTVVTHNDSIEYEWKAPELGATDSKEDGRAIKQYVAAGAQIPEFMLGDVTDANYSATFVSENPFVRAIEFYQDLFEGFFAEMFERVIKQGIKSGAIPAMSTETVLIESGPAMSRFRKALNKLGIQEADKNGNIKVVKKIPTSTEVNIDWPTILHKDQLDEAKTMQLHQEMGLVSTETLRGRAGYEQELEEQRMAAEAKAAKDAAEVGRDEAIAAGNEEDDDEGEDDEDDK